MVVWLIGLAGAGKTSIGKELYSVIKEEYPSTVFLDGDHFREIFNDDLGHTVDEREINGWRICKMCQFLDSQNINVVCSILSLFPEQRTWNRETYSNYFEVYIDVSMKELEARDQKSLYSEARKGNIKDVVGVDIEFVPPIEPNMVIKNNAHQSEFKSSAMLIFEKLYYLS
jgi:cytidine diphosphoramidate kinase